MLPALLTTILFAISAVSAGRTTRILGGAEANFWRLSLATVMLGAWAHSMGHGLSGAAVPYLLISGLVGLGIGDLALYQAFPKLGARLCMILVHCTAAPFAAVVEWLWLGTTVTVWQVACAGIILAGVALALAPDHRMKISRETFVSGVFFGTIAGCGQGMGAVLSRKGYVVAESAGQKIATLNDGITAAYQRILAGWVVSALFFVFWKFIQRRAKSEPVRESSGKLRMAWPWVVSNALAGPTLGVSCLQLALVTESTAVVLPIVAVTPLVVIPFARWTEGDRPGVRTLAGSVIAVIGVILLTRIRLGGLR